MSEYHYILGGLFIAPVILYIISKLAEFWQDKAEEKSGLVSYTHFKFPEIIIRHKGDE